MLGTLWSRTRAFVARLFRRKPPAPGRFERGAKFSWRGWLAVAPWIWPQRDYLLYIPKGHVRWRRVPLLVFIHGCRQSAEEFAAGTRIAAFADARGCLVLLPCQNPRANTWGCWNWFDRWTARGDGEAAIVAAQIRSVRRRYRVHRKRVFAAGLSAGAGLVAILAMYHARLLAGAMLHSGVAAGAASSALAALSVLTRGPDRDVARVAIAARAAAGRRAHAVPILAVHGIGDGVVAPVHATEIVRQALAYAGSATAPGSELPTPDREVLTDLGDGRRLTTRDWDRDGKLAARLVLVEGLGHAWSGGDPAMKYNDPRPPDACALLGAFMQDVLR